MKIYIPNSSTTKIGGGFSFLKNFTDSLPALGSEYVNTPEEADIILISGATMVNRDQFNQYKQLNKKIVLRVDGIPENWRNRGTGWPRLKEFAHQSDLVIYQSEFSKGTTGALLGKNGIVIYNGVDETIFKKDGDKLPRLGNPMVLYCNFRKGEHNKRVEEAIERFRMLKLAMPEAFMVFVGDYSKEQFLWNEKDWDFGMLDLKKGIDWDYLGIVSDRNQLAYIMRACDFVAFPSFADPCPNTLVEAMCCGCIPYWVNDYGGQKEIVDKFFDMDWSKERMTKEYLIAFEELLK